MRARAAWLLFFFFMFNSTSLGGSASKGGDSGDLEARIQEAVKLHNAGDYGSAIRLYRRMLRAHPENLKVLYEISSSTFAKGDYKRAISLAERALKKDSPYAALCHGVIGNSYDMLGELGKGEEAFRAGLLASPDDVLLHFNLGINLGKQGRLDSAITEFKEALVRNPSHPGSWLSLAKVLDQQGQRARAFFAYVRFLALEPDSDRSKAPANRLWALMFQGVDNKPREGDAGTTVIMVHPPGKGVQTDRGSLETTAMSVVAATRFLDEWKEKSDSEFFPHALESLTQILSEMEESQEPRDPFWGPYVASYFRQARDAGHLETLAYDIGRSRRDPAELRWLEEHREALDGSRAWSKSWRAPPTRSEAERP